MSAEGRNAVVAEGEIATVEVDHEDRSAPCRSMQTSAWISSATKLSAGSTWNLPLASSRC